MPAETNRSVSFTLTAEDYATANKLYVLKSYKGGVGIIAVAGMLLLYGLFFRSEYAGDGSYRWLATVFYGAAIGLLALPLLSYFVLAPRSARKTYRQQKSLQQPLTFSWSQAGLKVTSEAGEWLTPWDHYLKRAENDETLLFYQAPRLFQMLPKRVLAPEQLADLRECAISVKG
jgi:hypothetical protein